MEDLTPLVNYVKKYIPLTEGEESFFISLLQVTKVKKRQYIHQPGYICQYRNYVLKGALRAFISDNNGQEHTISLAIEDWWIADPASFILREPGTFFVEAVEDSTIVQISYEAEQQLMQQYPKFERFYRVTSQLTAIHAQKRLLSNISQTAEERYETFAGRYSQLLQRFPLYIIASYLGMTREFLSKIRNRNLPPAQQTTDSSNNVN
ncbi:Crp/Fnr family transcriptional regulator [Chitinophaga agrisoli]|uniref:Crp/Fnr family transcriptional regulator n=1 Tax=Chitinophaga agrisoli TaxID=2607653 RepID=A0A5B2VZD4_9BACT|nr:Crp/Fnr family transcriptional regulator [Chitinophaga agrisoli]KAA2243389.1 Crp/Fnr family transcriptional regulator [Chitinophaga agrisoli]